MYPPDLELAAKSFQSSENTWEGHPRLLPCTHPNPRGKLPRSQLHNHLTAPWTNGSNCASFLKRKVLYTSQGRYLFCPWDPTISLTSTSWTRARKQTSDPMTTCIYLYLCSWLHSLSTSPVTDKSWCVVEDTAWLGNSVDKGLFKSHGILTNPFQDQL